MRSRLLTIPAIGRALGFALIAVAIVAAAEHFASGDRSARSRPPEASTSTDPLEREMTRCQALALAAKDDAACEAAWAENRRRFFTYLTAPSGAATPSAAPNPLKQ